jgi:hypothetical protein
MKHIQTRCGSYEAGLPSVPMIVVGTFQCLC